jgi:hypothetical protein
MSLVDAIRGTIVSAANGDEQSIFLLGAIYILLICGYSVVWQIRMNSWPHVTGHLERLGLRKFGATEWAVSDQEYVSDALYTYRVDGLACIFHEGGFVSHVLAKRINLIGGLLRSVAQGLHLFTFRKNVPSQLERSPFR